LEKKNNTGAMTQVMTQTGTKENYLQEFAAFSPLYGNTFTALRKSSMEAFKQHGFPGQKHEEWKYFNLAPLLQERFTIATASVKSNITREMVARYKVAGENAIMLVFVNGIFRPDLSDTDKNKTITAGSILNHETEDFIGKSGDVNEEPFLALNNAFFSDGACIRIPAGARVENPVHILHLNDSRTEQTASFPRNLIIAEKNSKAQVIATYHSLTPDKHSFCNAVTELFLNPGSFLELDIKQNEEASSFHIGQVYASLQRDCTFDICTVTLGGGMVRNNLLIRLNDTNCTAHLNGLTLAGGNQVVDHHTVVDHASPGCYSNQLYKGIFDGHAHGVFNGKILVRRDAQKTNAYQSNKTVLLSHDAVMNAKPQLEIFADDVKCSHGATTGQLDEDALFYFRARGIGEQDAKALLNFAFASDVIQKINNDSMKENVLKLLSEKLHAQIEFDLG